jgi:succinoglycan biosynthesis transport protein ExoP
MNKNGLIPGPHRPRAFPPATQQWSDAGGENAEFSGLLASWNLILARKFTVLALMLGCLLAAAGFTLLQTPTYRTRTAIQVEPRNEYLLNLRELDPTVHGDSGETYLQTQAQILQSESVIRQALARLNRPAPAPSNPIRDLAHRFRPAATASIMTEGETTTWLAQSLFVRPARQGHVIELVFEYSDPNFAADFLNALTASFLDQHTAAREASGTLTRARLKEQLSEVQTQLIRSEENLQHYARAAGLVFTSEKTSAAEDQLRALEQELAAARADRIQRQSQSDVAATKPPASLPPVLDNVTLRDYQVKLMELRRQRAELLSLFTPNHPDVKQVQAQIQEMETSLASQRADVVDRIRNDYEAALHREKLLTGVVDEQTKQVSTDSVNSVRYRILQREVETNRALYDMMLQRARNAILASALETGNIRVIDAATAPSRPFKPRLAQNAALGGLGGLVLGMLVVLVGEGKDRRIRSPLELRSYIDAQQLGVVPFVEAPRHKPKASLSTPLNGGELGPTAARWSHDVRADSFRAALTSILSANGDGVAPQVIVITSPTMGDGKTTVVANLGMAVSEVKGRVLLIDADSRNPNLHRMFGVRNTVGLTDILNGDVELDDSLLHLIKKAPPLITAHKQDGPGGHAERRGLHLMTVGSAVENAGALFYRMDLLLGILRREFDTILIDTPPMLHLPDARVLGKRADGVVLVLRSGQTSAMSAREALLRLDEDYICTLGTVLNAFDASRSPYKYYGPYPAAGKQSG